MRRSARLPNSAKEVIHCLVTNLVATWYGQAIAVAVPDLGPNRNLRL
jgi:hypothetical protein